MQRCSKIKEDNDVQENIEDDEDIVKVEAEEKIEERFEMQENAIYEEVGKKHETTMSKNN